MVGRSSKQTKVEDFKEFITVALPKVLKGILAIVALGIGAKILKFAIMIGKGTAMLLKNLLKLGKNLIRFATKNPKLALALGVAGLATAAVVTKQAQQLSQILMILINLRWMRSMSLVV